MIIFDRTKLFFLHIWVRTGCGPDHLNVRGDADGASVETRREVVAWPGNLRLGHPQHFMEKIIGFGSNFPLNTPLIVMI